MIYLIDQPLTSISHSKFIIDIIKEHTDTNIELIEILNKTTLNVIKNTIINLFDKVHSNDIVLCPWAIEANYEIDELFDQLAEYCWVVVAAGNFNADIKNWSPARAYNVITVACLNKSGKKATLSNWSDNKKLIWIPGTNYNVGSKLESGTSVSAALYAAFLSETIKREDPEYLEKIINKYCEEVYSYYKSETKKI